MSEQIEREYEPRHLAGTVVLWKQNSTYVPRHASEVERDARYQEATEALTDAR
jgi:hypothetical protein